MKDRGGQQQYIRQVLTVGSCLISSLWTQLGVSALGGEVQVNSPSSPQSPQDTMEDKQLEVRSHFDSPSDTLAIAPPELDLERQQLEFSPLQLQISQDVEEEFPQQLMENLPSVGDFSDVKPTDWAYQALKSLVERYRVIAGDANRKFRGNQPLTRYEFASALARTFSAVQDLLADALEEYVREDAIIIQRLRREFAVNLQELEKRIDRTEVKAAEIQANLFSTTTKLQAQTIIAATGGINTSNRIVARSRLSLHTSFRGRDRLITELEAGNSGDNTIGQESGENIDLLGNHGIFADASELKYGQFSPDLRLRRLAYSFHPHQDMTVTIGAKISPRDYIDQNSYAGNEAINFSSGLFLNNPLIIQNQIDRQGGAGIAVNWQPKDSSLAARGLYIAANADNPDGEADQGLFGDNRQGSLEVEFQPIEQLKVKLQYTNALVNSTDINAFGLNAEYKFNRNLGVFGRVGIGKYEGFNTRLNRDLNTHPLSWSVGVGLRNVVIPTTLAGVAIGQPFVTGDIGDATQTNLEAFYNLPLSDYISVTPIFSLVINPNNDSSNGTIWQSSLRTVFSF